MIVRLANRILMSALPNDEASETIRNDLAEELRLRRDGRHRAVHALWYLWEALKLAGHFLLLRFDRRVPGSPRGPSSPRTIHRQTRSSGMRFDTCIQDVRFALRTFARKPLFTAVATLTLALGIGGSTAMFSVVDRVLLRPLPYHEPDRIVSIRQIMEGWKDVANLRESWDRAWLHPDQFAVLREDATTFSAVAVHNQSERTLRGEGRPEVLSVGRGSSELLAVLGVPPARGRWFTRDEEGNVDGPSPVVVLSDQFRRSHFSDDQEILGALLQLGNQAHTVVGVLPPDFHLREFNWGGMDAGHRDVWIPGGHTCCYQWEAIGRLAPGATIEQAEAELHLLRPDADPAARRFSVIPRRRAESEGLTTPLALLLGATALLLLIACGNVATLLLGELADREHEIAARSALGAGRAKITRQLLTESVVLGALGSLAGVGLARMLTPVVVRLGPTLPRMDEISVDGRVLAAAIAIGTASVLFFGLLPALIATGDSLHSRLQGGGRGSSARTSHLSAFVVAFELALTTALLVSGGLLARSFGQLMDTDPGIDAEGLVALTIRPRTPNTEAEVEQLLARSREIRAALESVPGVTAVTVSSDLPFISKPTSTTTFLTDGARGSTALYWRVDPTYHATMGMRLLSGRLLTDADADAKASVAVVSESLARANWPNRSPLGEEFEYYQREPVAVVGVVADVKHETLAYRTEPVFYMPLVGEQPPMAFAVRTSRRQGAVMSELREAVLAIDPGALIETLSPYERLVAQSAAVERFRMMLTTGFAIAATILAGIGVMGITARAVAGHRRELGIRMALGARQGSLVWEVVRRHLRLAAGGVTVGLFLAIWSGRLITSFLFGVAPGDPLTFTSVTVGVLILALVATYVPARRIAALDPATVLRPE
jgi:predicted permease